MATLPGLEEKLRISSFENSLRLMQLEPDSRKATLEHQMRINLRAVVCVCVDDQDRLGRFCGKGL